uniref:hypothetical protein n=1 Tax=Flavobacterium sp. TaxID=239 RepID=UPI00404B4BF1
MIVAKNNIFKISTFSLAIVLMSSMVYIYHSKNSFQRFKEKAEIENQLKQNHLDEILHKYDSVTAIANLLHSDTVFPTIEESQQISNDFFKNSDLKTINKQINVLNTTLKKDKISLDLLSNKITLNKSTLVKLEALKQPNVSIKANKLSVLNITARGVKILSDKLPKSKNKIIQELRICFTVEGNELVKKGEKKLYIQVVNPKNQIISSEETFIELQDVKLIYSAKVDTSYNQNDIDICTYVDLEKEKTIKGKYKINIYNDFSKIGTTIFEYN